jgi:OmpA-OmpF porin, OOP family
MTRLVILFTFLFPLVAFTQSKQVWLYTADNFFEKQDYASALKYYRLTLEDTVVDDIEINPYEQTVSNQKLPKGQRVKMNKKVSLKDYCNHQAALCYAYTYDYIRAEEMFTKNKGNNSYPDDQFHLGIAQMKVGKYSEATNSFDTYLNQASKNDSIAKLAQQAKLGCVFAVDPKSNKNKVIVNKADSTFNAGTSSFAPTYFGYEDRMMFTSARKGGVLFDPEKQQSEYLCDLYWVERKDETSWGVPHNFGRPLNSAQHDAAGVTSKSNVFYYTKWNDAKKEDQSLYLARMQEFLFFESNKMDSAVNVPGTKSITPFVTADAKLLFFASNRKGGFGGFDLYRISLDEQGLPFGNAVNLGSEINSASDEVTPFYHETTSILFFSSNGLNSIGGLDIFKSTMDRETFAFYPPTNLGSPINSSKDDAYPIFDEFLQQGYFSTDREPCDGGSCYKIYTIENEPIVVELEGNVFDEKTEKPIKNAKITFKDVRSNFQTFSILTDENGYYKTQVALQSEVFIKVQNRGYFAASDNLDTRSISASIVIRKDFYLRTIPNDEIEITGIEYDFNSANLRPQSKLNLDTLFRFLELNDNLSIDINSHTDSRGVDIYNLDLSQRRAKAVVDYLISKGTDPKRLFAKGFGETQPIFLTNKKKEYVLDTKKKRIALTEAYINTRSPKAVQEELHQRNRRTAFRVVLQE